MLQLVADQISIALERERLMTELQARNIELADADKRKDEFLAMLAHELRNPLAPIVNALHVAGLDAQSRGGSVARAHATMERQVRHSSGSSTICSTSRASRTARSSCAASAPSCRPSSSRRCRSRARVHRRASTRSSSRFPTSASPSTST